MKRSPDVIIVGAGAAGMAAALRAAERGASALLVTNSTRLGGLTTRSIGVFAAAGTRLQRAAGVEDSPDAFLADYEQRAVADEGRIQAAYWREAAKRENPALRTLLFRRAPQAVDWLLDQGVPIKGPYPLPPFETPRAHVVTPNAEALATSLGARLHQQGVDVLYQHTLTGLVMNAAGVGPAAVAGVRLTTALGDVVEVQARSAVILATGDFGGSAALRERFTTDARSPAIYPLNQGEGIRLAMEQGAAVGNMDLQHAGFRTGEPLYTGPHWANLCRAGASLVSARGQRLPTDLPVYDLLAHVRQRDDGPFYLIFDTGVAEQFRAWPHYISTFPGKPYGYIDDYMGTDYLIRTNSLVGLGERLGMADHLPGPEWRLVQAPFYALGPLNLRVVFTDGGLQVNDQMQVLTTESDPIQRLYAAGATAQGRLGLAAGGLHLSWALVSGIVAAESVT